MSSGEERSVAKRRRRLAGRLAASVVIVGAAASVPLSAAQTTVHTPPREFDPERATFSVRFKNEVSPYHVIAAFVLPEERLKLEAVGTHANALYTARASIGEITAGSEREWLWTAPKETGLYSITIFQTAPADSIRLNVFVMIPYTKLESEYLNGYRIGTYPSTPLRHLPIYQPPRGFVEVTPENQETLVAPHFTLRQFLCKQAGDWPKYVVLRERLLLKLEVILEAVNREGHAAPTLAILSGYRTPYYNRAIGNVRYSRHVWGDAADIYLDVDPADGLMDDVNGDSKIDYRDAAVLYGIIDRMYGKAWYAPLIGGLGRYPRTRNHGPFVHVDTRGTRARWGT